LFDRCVTAKGTKEMLKIFTNWLTLLRIQSAQSKRTLL